MKFMKLSFLFSVGVILLLTATSAFAQKDFDNPNVDYTFVIPSDTWKITVEPSDVSPNVELVYGYKKDGHLEIRKMTVEANTLLGDIIRDEEPTLQFLPGYVASKEENFRGAYSGRVFNYEFVRSGRPMRGRIYYLKIDDTTVFSVRVTGLKDKIGSILNELDIFARTFKLKEKK